MTEEIDSELPLSREELYELAWSEPMTSIGKKFGVSSSYLARVYSRLNVPRPPPGYWAKLEAGKKVVQPPLPEVRPEDELEWDRNHVGSIRARPQPKAPSKAPRAPARSRKPRGTHRMLGEARAHFLKSRKPFNDYLRPYKKLLVDIIVSEKSLTAALNLANELFYAFEDCGYRVTLEAADARSTRPTIDEREKPGRNNRYENHWRPQRNTVVHVGTVTFGLTLIETSRNVETRYINGDYIPVDELTAAQKRYRGTTWSSNKDVPTGKFILQAYSPYQGTDWIERYPIDATKDLTKIGHKIARSLHSACPEVVAQAEAAEKHRQQQQREWEEQRKRWERERLEELHRKAREESLGNLHQIIVDWAEAERLHAFFDELGKAVSELPANEQPAMVARIEEARKFIANPAPLERLRRWRSPDEIVQEKENYLSNGIILP